MCKSNQHGKPILFEINDHILHVIIYITNVQKIKVFFLVKDQYNMQVCSLIIKLAESFFFFSNSNKQFFKSVSRVYDE